MVARKTLKLLISFVPSPKKRIPDMVSGSIQPIKKYPATAVIRIEVIFPILSACCTSASLASLFEIRMRKVPIMEAMIPTPAIIMGSSMGPIPPNGSSNWLPVASVMSLII